MSPRNRTKSQISTNAPSAQSRDAANSKFDKSRKSVQKYNLEFSGADTPSQFVHVNDVVHETAQETIDRALTGQKDYKAISDENRPDRSGKRVTEDRGNLKRISGMFPSSIADQIEAISKASNTSMSKLVVDMVSKQLAEVGEEISQNDAVVTLNLPPDISPETRRTIQKLATVIAELADDSPSL